MQRWKGVHARITCISSRDNAGRRADAMTPNRSPRRQGVQQYLATVNILIAGYCVKEIR